MFAFNDGSMVDCKVVLTPSAMCRSAHSFRVTSALRKPQRSILVRFQRRFADLMAKKSLVDFNANTTWNLYRQQRHSIIFPGSRLRPSHMPAATTNLDAVCISLEVPNYTTACSQTHTQLKPHPTVPRHRCIYPGISSKIRLAFLARFPYMIRTGACPRFRPPCAIHTSGTSPTLEA